MKIFRVLVMLLLSLALLPFSAGLAHAGTSSAYNGSACWENSSFRYRYARLHVLAIIKATDHGSSVKVNPGSLGWAVAKSCDGNTDFALSKSVSLKFTAYGWGISCSPSLPGYASCSGSSTARTISLPALSGQYPVYLTREISSSESIYFSDGVLGDTTKVCATVHGVMWGKGVTATACTSV